MTKDNPLGYYATFDPKYSQTYIDAMKIGPTDGDCYNIQYHHSIIDSDNVDDSIKVKVLYNELMSLKTEFSAAQRTLMGEISYLNAEYRRIIDENKKLEDEITAIKQALYFG